MAKKTKFHFNQETLSFEKIEMTFVKVVKYVALHLFTGLGLGVIAFFVISSVLPSPLEKSLRKENAELKNNYAILDRRISGMNGIMADLQQRDNNLYRVIFQTDPIDRSLRHSNVIKEYDKIDNMSNSRLIDYAIDKANDVAKQIYVQSKSYDELFLLSKKQEEKLQCLPAIQPVMNKDLSRVASGYGYRNDPVYHTTRFHAGMDFTAPTGTDIYATGNGKIDFAGWRQGYGNCVIINHGFDYETLYGHLSTISVREGQKVTRGEIIGLVGSTGKSTGPHLHYEVHFRGQIQDPRNFYFLDLTPEEYDRMISLSENSGQVFD
ncbi:MAG: M23 family metallopeptidase [Prevotellaceae bacterium]|jgi:murein DD-endopeptidase MepM/ murein hydrolase activator NlpD|nr:M23 family metallopeptidase [Prevotellaceae bacterium]